LSIRATVSGRLALVTLGVVVALHHDLRGASICAMVADQLGQPLRGAAITVVDLAGSDPRVSGDSDAKGRVCVQGVPDGEYSVESSAPGFMHAVNYPVVVRSPEEITLPFRLVVGSFDPLRSTYVGTDATIYGTLSNGSKPVPNLRICLFQGDKGDAPMCTNTNDIGQYQLVV
jgi:hypothetical protein